MTNNDPITDLTAAMIEATDRRLAEVRSWTPAVMPDRPTDRSRNGMRGFRPSPKRRTIR